MRLHVIGSGSSGNCYVLEGERTALLIECGVPYRSMLKGIDFDAGKICAALVSHEHGDHAGHMGKYADELGIGIYASGGTLRALGMVGRRNIIAIDPKRHYRIGEFSVITFPVQHDAAEPLGFIITHEELGNLLFATDTYYVRFNFSKFNIDHFMIEANYDRGIVRDNLEKGVINSVYADRLITSHMSLDHTIRMLEANMTPSCRSVTLIHLSGRNSDPRAFQSRVEERFPMVSVNVAEKGLKIDFNDIL